MEDSSTSASVMEWTVIQSQTEPHAGGVFVAKLLWHKICKNMHFKLTELQLFHSGRWI